MQKTSKFKHIKKLMSKYQFYQARSLNKKWQEQENIYTSHLSKEHDRQGPRSGWWTSSPSPARWGWIGVLRFQFVVHCGIGGFGESRSFTSTSANTLNIAKVICKCMDYLSIHAQQIEIPEPRQYVMIKCSITLFSSCSIARTRTMFVSLFIIKRWN
jgi:hypothetical protein